MRFVVLVLRAAALVVALWALLARADCALVTGTCPAFNLFSYFTVHSTLLLIVAVLLALLSTAVRGAEPVWLTAFRALATTYTVVSGAVFAVLLANAELFGHLFLVPLSSKVMHFVLPVYAVADFLLGPYRHRLRWSTVWLAMVFPALWALYTLARGRPAGCPASRRSSRARTSRTPAPGPKGCAAAERGPRGTTFPGGVERLCSPGHPATTPAARPVLEDEPVFPDPGTGGPSWAIL
ncbi:hypothetical protein GCM10011374_24080 [Kocuria dechangensis]|uniref:Integral membrane protein n=1 Tax=Kocuria dechangensis TaxID=1176249 RepID=A0A917LWS3_9MICC|nr:Pr6Pr family membrane protein [Kocuria dechangensis]GGG60415.1 hypothetical protein GCM10011374_24080 [Kocuria dechangensis]